MRKTTRKRMSKRKRIVLLSIAGVLGALLSVAGLGGCIMVLVTNNAVPKLIQTLDEQYY